MKKYVIYYTKETMGLAFRDPEHLQLIFTSVGVGASENQALSGNVFIGCIFKLLMFCFRSLSL